MEPEFIFKVQSQRGFLHDIYGVIFEQWLWSLVVDVVDDDEDVGLRGERSVVGFVGYYGQLEHLALEVVSVDRGHVKNRAGVPAFNCFQGKERVCRKKIFIILIV